MLAGLGGRHEWRDLIHLIFASVWLRLSSRAACRDARRRRNLALRREHHDWLVERCRERDFTLRGLVAELAERGLKVDYRSVWEFVHAEALSFKKNAARQRTGSTRRGAAAGAVEKTSGPG